WRRMSGPTNAAVRSVEPATSEWWMIVIWGIASVLVGLWLFAQPVASAITLLTVLALVWLIGGVVDIVGDVIHRTTNWGWRVGAGVFNVVVALFVLGNPVFGTLTAVSVLYLLIAISALYNGLVGLFGNTERSTARVVLSVLQIVLGCLMLVGLFD